MNNEQNVSPVNQQAAPAAEVGSGQQGHIFCVFDKKQKKVKLHLMSPEQRWMEIAMSSAAALNLAHDIITVVNRDNLRSHQKLATQLMEETPNV